MDLPYGPNTGEQTGIDYSDSTQDITFTYNRLGQQKTVTDVVGTRTFAYNSDLQPTTETIVGGLYSKTITRDYATTGMVGRNTGLHIGTEYDVDYGYDTYGRFSTITNGTDVYTYAYLTNSNLVSSISYPNNISVTNSYEPNRNLITAVDNKVGATSLSRYDYTYDAIRRRSDVDWSGTAFSASDTITYGYNNRSEVTSADATVNANYNYTYNFDNIGNRETYTSSESGNPVQSLYTLNNLNQYTAITNPSQSPTYDDDGNMLTLTLESGSWTNTFNAENRIIAQEKTDTKLEFKYDYKGRRVEKKVYSGSTGNWTLDKHFKFVYDKYEQIEELDGANSDTILKKRIWGLNKIVADIHSSITYYALGDANKNITEYIDSDGAVQAHYEYSPFGKITKQTGTMQDDFDYRFSSEVFDIETGLVYYNFRYYSPELGRWLSRDPIEEEGGYNLYGMVGNNPVVYWDVLGLGFWKWAARVGTTVAAGIVTEGLGALVVAGLWATEGIADGVNYYNQNEIDKYNADIEQEKITDPNDHTNSSSKCRRLRSQQTKSALNFTKKMLSEAPNTILSGPIVSASAHTPPASRANAVTGNRPGFKTTTGYMKKNGTFVHRYHRGYKGGTKIPKNYNKGYRKTQPPK